ncbi:MAG: type I DNA topoisomerase [Chloroflexota bacterium]
MKKSLVIVESPAKARTLSKILGRNYDLKASLGHIRDLPKSRLGVDVENEFTPKYVVPRDKSKLVRELKKAAQDASTVYLATDPDREGEAISWHLAEVTKSDDTSYRRVVFHEITKEAVLQAFKQPRSIDIKLVNAQQARRVLDRLVGYKLSPLLWRKVRRGLSAGRVQSVALKIIVDREKEIRKFKPEEYWTIEADLAKKPAGKNGKSFRAILVGPVDGTRLEIHQEKEATALQDALKQADYSVFKIATKKITRQPAPPFITSTLQQEAWRKLHMSARQTMAIAQQLYEGLSVGKEGSVGLITYMRTDSTHVAREAIVEAREFIGEKYGKAYLPAHARTFIGRIKGAQEAHEAIRPTSIKREPQLIKSHLSSQQVRLYELIWKRMVASQMSVLILDSTTVDVAAKCGGLQKDNYLFQATSAVTRFPGFTVLYTEGRDDNSEKEKKELPLPELKKADALQLLELFPEQHFTQPPPRYTEASLVKVLEKEGIGRPSTYASIISTVQERDYVTKTSGHLVPTELGILVNDLIARHFPDIVDTKFTARMENELDEVATENREWTNVVREFYLPFDKSLEAASLSIEKIKIADEVTDEICPECGKPMVIKNGRFGKFIACSGYPECKHTKSFQVKTGAHCPEPGCSGELVQRRSKKKRTFFGCSNYPECRFTISSQPLPHPCPRCGSLLTVYRKNWEKCTKKDCDYRAKIAEEGKET